MDTVVVHHVYHLHLLQLLLVCVASSSSSTDASSVANVAACACLWRIKLFFLLRWILKIYHSMMTLVGRPSPDFQVVSSVMLIKMQPQWKLTCNNPSTSNDPSAGIIITPDQYQSCLAIIRDVAYYHEMKYHGPDECPCFSEFDVQAMSFALYVRASRIWMYKQWVLHYAVYRKADPSHLWAILICYQVHNIKSVLRVQWQAFLHLVSVMSTWMCQQWYYYWWCKWIVCRMFHFEHQPSRKVACHQLIVNECNGRGENDNGVQTCLLQGCFISCPPECVWSE